MTEREAIQKAWTAFKARQPQVTGFYDFEAGWHAGRDQTDADEEEWEIRTKAFERDVDVVIGPSTDWITVVRKSSLTASEQRVEDLIRHTQKLQRELHEEINRARLLEEKGKND